MAKQNIKITLISKSLNGWIKSYDTKSNIFEQGPRSLRPELLTVKLISELGLSDQVITQQALARYLLYENIQKISPLKLLPDIIKEIFKRKTLLHDESIEQFVTRRFSKEISDNLISGIIHGIYAGDYNKLSVKSCMPLLWKLEQSYSSVSLGMTFEQILNSFSGPYSNDMFINNLMKSSIYSFKKGLETLPNAIHSKLLKMPNVQIINDTTCEGIDFENMKVSIKNIKSNSVSSIPFDHIISAISSNDLSKLVPSDLSKELSKIPYVNVAVVNLLFNGKLLAINGFGYLVPKPHFKGILGVVFDSCVFPNQDYKNNTTKLTIMMGGHEYEKYYKNSSKQELLQIALNEVKQTLKIKNIPIYSDVYIHRNCIPQYYVGHSELLKKLDEIVTNNYENKISLVGSSYRGVSVNDCIKNSKKLVDGLHLR